MFFKIEPVPSRWQNAGQPGAGRQWKSFTHIRPEDERSLSSAAAAAADCEREFQSQHHYTLEEFGPSKEWIQEELSLLLDHYSLAR